MNKSETIVSHRQCFSTDAGKRVLCFLLMDGGYFDTTLQTEGEIAVQNFVKKIVMNLGILTAKKRSDDVVEIIGVDSYVNGLFNLPSEI